MSPSPLFDDLPMLSILVEDVDGMFMGGNLHSMIRTVW